MCVDVECIGRIIEITIECIALNGIIGSELNLNFGHWFDLLLAFMMFIYLNLMMLRDIGISQIKIQQQIKS